MLRMLAMTTWTFRVAVCKLGWFGLTNRFGHETVGRSLGCVAWPSDFITKNGIWTDQLHDAVAGFQFESR